MKSPSRLSFFALALALAAGSVTGQTAQTAVAAGKDQVEVAQLVELNGTITALDYKTRDVSLKTDEGEVVSFVAGDEVKRLDEIKVGDRVEIQYYESLAISLSRSDAAASAAVASAEVRAEPTELPGGVKANKATISAKITAIDEKAGTVTLVGPKGRSVTLDVAPDMISKFKVGDLVNAVYTEAVAASVARADKK